MKILNQPRSGMLFAVLCLGTVPAIAQQASYTVIDLGTVGGRVTEALDLNEAGQVTGYSETADGQFRAFLYEDGEMRDLGELAPGGSVGHALNDSGAVTGLTAASDGHAHAFRYENGTMADLGTNGLSSNGSDINNAGDIAGDAVGSDGLRRAVIFRGGNVVDLGAPASFATSALALNEAGQAAGTYDDAAGSHAFLFNGSSAVDLVPGRTSVVFGNQSLNAAGQVAGGFQGDDTAHCFLYQGGQLSDPGSLGGGYCLGVGVNANGAMTGISATASGERHAFAYSGGVMTDLGTLGGDLSIGYAINDAGRVVGESAIVAGGDSRAFVYVDGKMIDLGALLQGLSGLPVTESVAFDINSSGQVLGRYTVHDASDPTIPFQSRAFIATPAGTPGATMFDKLLGLLGGIGPVQVLLDTVGQARDAYLGKNLEQTCSAMTAFSAQVRELAGTQIDLVRAVLLQTEAVAIRGVLGCR
jgi:probable HAF family extracellular repeat protein